MTSPLTGGAVDLAALAQQPNTFKCEVPDGCQYTVRDKKHETLKDCVDTAVVYAEQIAQEAALIADAVGQAQALALRVQELSSQVSTLIGANRRFQDDLATREAELREVRTFVRNNLHEAQEGSDGKATGTEGS